MSGILERIEAKLDSILAMSSPIDKSDLLSHDDVQEKLSPRDVLLEDERDQLGKGVTWDTRIHTSTKKQSQKNIWKRKPGLSDDFFNAVMAELSEMLPLAEEKSESVEPTKKAPPIKPSKKAPPVKKAPPKSPVRQGDEHKFKPRAMKNIASLTTDFEASHELILENLISKHGVDTLDALSEESHEELFEDSHDWLNTLNSLQHEIDILDGLSEKEDGSFKDTINESVSDYIKDAGGTSNKLGSIPMANLESLQKEISEYLTSWEEYFE